DAGSALHRFRPDVVLFAFDARHMTSGLQASDDADAADAALESTQQRLRQCWQLARGSLGAAVLQQTVLPVLPTLMGNNEHLLPGSPARQVQRLNAWMRPAAADAGVYLIAADAHAAQDGLRQWHDPTLWHSAKQEISPAVAPLYGELVGRLFAALQGRSAK